MDFAREHIIWVSRTSVTEIWASSNPWRFITQIIYVTGWYSWLRGTWGCASRASDSRGYNWSRAPQLCASHFCAPTCSRPCFMGAAPAWVVDPQLDLCLVDTAACGGQLWPGDSQRFSEASLDLECFHLTSPSLFLEVQLGPWSDRSPHSTQNPTISSPRHSLLIKSLRV